jgi:hypothetical protein
MTFVASSNTKLVVGICYDVGQLSSGSWPYQDIRDACFREILTLQNGQSIISARCTSLKFTKLLSSEQYIANLPVASRTITWLFERQRRFPNSLLCQEEQETAVISESSHKLGLVSSENLNPTPLILCGMVLEA